MKHQLRFAPSRISDLEKEYVQANSHQREEDDILSRIGPKARAQRSYLLDDFLSICWWKTPRTQESCKKNSGQFVGDVTGIALTTPDERLRIEVLRILDGVDWSTASVLLHFGHNEPYPILDFRALWSLSIEEPSSYTFSFWRDYVSICREIAARSGITMRSLDRALWCYSEQHQAPRSKSKKLT